MLAAVAERSVPRVEGVEHRWVDVARRSSVTWCLGSGAKRWRTPTSTSSLEPARARAASQVYRSFLVEDAPSILRGSYRGQRLRQPILVLHGADDPVLPVKKVADLPQHADDARVEPVEGVAHFIVDEEPELVAERAEAFFA